MRALCAQLLGLEGELLISRGWKGHALPRALAASLNEKLGSVPGSVPIRFQIPNHSSE